MASVPDQTVKHLGGNGKDSYKPVSEMCKLVGWLIALGIIFLSQFIIYKTNSNITDSIKNAVCKDKKKTTRNKKSRCVLIKYSLGVLKFCMLADFGKNIIFENLVFDKLHFQKVNLYNH